MKNRQLISVSSGRCHDVHESPSNRSRLTQIKPVGLIPRTQLQTLFAYIVCLSVYLYILHIVIIIMIIFIYFY